MNYFVTGGSRGIGAACALLLAGLVERRVAAVHGLDEQLRPGVLEQKASGAGPERAVDVLVEVEGRDHHHRHRVRDAPPGEELGHLDAVEPGHPDVDQAHVGAEPTRQLDRSVAVGGPALSGCTGTRRTK